jgi:D-xylose transport system substrate-binding protein
MTGSLVAARKAGRHGIRGQHGIPGLRVCAAAETFPVTGQDATTVGLQNILANYQCGTVYKPIYLEAQAAVALAMFMRAGKTPPSSLVNGTTQDSKANVAVKSVLLQPTWVTTTNMASTVIADKFVTVAQLCVGQYVALCKTAGIS